MGHSTNGVASVVTPSCEQRALALGLTLAPSSAAGMLPVVCWHGATPPLCLVTSVRSSPGIPSHVCVRTRVHPRPRSPRRRGGPLRPLCCDQRYAGVAAPRIAPCHLPLAPRRDWPAVLACIHTFAHVSTSVHSYMFVHTRARAFRRRAGRHQRTSPTARCSAQRRPSTMGTSLALTNGTQEAFTIAAPPSQDMVLASLAMDEQRGLLPAHVWRASARLGDSHWLCSQCGLASPNDGGNGGNEGVEAASCCLKCATPKAQSERLRGTPAEKLALTTISEASAYGRKLLFLRGRGQVERLACGAVPGTPGYTEAVRRSNIEAFAPVSRVLDPIPRAWVVLLDGYLAVVHAAKYRVWSRQDCLAVIRLEETEGLLGEFLGTFARTVSVCVEGIYRLVQVCSTVYPQPTPLTAPATLAGDRVGWCLTCGHWFAWRRHIRHFPRADGGHVWRPP